MMYVPVERSILTVSLTLIAGSGNRILYHRTHSANISHQIMVQRLTDAAALSTHVRASCVTKNGMPPLPSWTRLTLPSLYSASSEEMRWTVKRPLVS